MKKIICVLGIVMLFASMVFAGGIGKADLASLKGTYEGTANTPVSSAHLKLEILNDTVPIKGKVTITKIAAPLREETGWGDEFTAEADNGVITNKGTIMFPGKGKNFFEITSMGKDSSGKLLLEGWFFGYPGVRATGMAVKADWSATKK